MIEHMCKSCGRTFWRYSTMQTICNKCQYNRISGRIRRKPIKRVGKVAKKWMETRQEWIKNNPPDDFGYWYCSLKLMPNCLVRMQIDELTLDHAKSRSRHPELRYELSNLQPACLSCNVYKGSLEVDELRKKI